MLIVLFSILDLFNCNSNKIVVQYENLYINHSHFIFYIIKKKIVLMIKIIEDLLILHFVVLIENRVIEKSTGITFMQSQNIETNF